MLLKILVLVLLIIIFYCLGSAVVYLVRDGSSAPEKMAKALTWRIVLSLVLFLLLILSFSLGVS